MNPTVNAIRTTSGIMLLVLLLLGMGEGHASATAIRVKFSATGANNGSSWTNAYTNLQTALAAALSGDEIWVAAGTYKPTSGTDRAVSFVMKSGVALYGGFAGSETTRDQRNWTVNATILSGNIGVASGGDNSYRVVIGASDAVLDGFTVTGGNANDSGGVYGGGGMYNATSSPTVANCIFSSNAAGAWGGGMYNSDSSPSVTNCTFNGNSSGNSGGGMHNSGGSPEVTNCVFSSNTSSSGGGIYNDSSLTLTNCVFDNNSAAGGGGIYNYGSGLSTLETSCTFSNNHASYYGGGMDNSYGGSPAVVSCIFSNNSAPRGGAMANNSGGSPIVTGCAFSQNTATYGGAMHNENSSATVTGCRFESNAANAGSGYGGGIMNTSGSSLTLTDCVFNNNSARGYGGGMENDDASLAMTNCVFSNNNAYDGGAMYVYNSSPTVTNTTFCHNSATHWGGCLFFYNWSNTWPTVINSILWDHSASSGAAVYNYEPEPQSLPSFSHCDIQGSGGSGAQWDTTLGTDGGGNIVCDPRFVNSASPVGPDGIWRSNDDGFALLASSPCVNTGAPAGAPLTDILGNSRASVPDMGAYEYHLTYILAYNSGANGSITGITPQTVNPGASGTTVTAVPASNYHFVRWSDGRTDSPRMDTNVTTDVSVTALFAHDTGSLITTITPQGAIDAGARWRRTGTSTWFDSGAVEGDIPTGSYTVEFKALTGWTSPSNQSVTITNGGTAAPSGTYIRQTGSLTVTITPQGAIGAGAQWRRSGTSAWLNSGTAESVIPTGDYMVEFKAVAGWTVPSSQAVTITNGGSVTTSGTYVQQFGSLNVTAHPMANFAGASVWRRQGTTTWRMSGVESDVPVGSYAIEFKDYTGWTTPANQSVEVTNSQTTIVDGTYTRQTGSVSVTIAPQGAIDAGAQWRRTGTSTWFDSGAVEGDIPTGSYTVEFKALTGWTSPSNQPMTITNGGTAAPSGTYIRQTGSLTVTITPQGAIDAGAQWRRTGTSAWLNSGTAESVIPTGDYMVEFKAVAGWTVPSSQAVTVTDGGSATASGAYVQQFGSLNVTAHPMANFAGASVWRRQGTTTWRMSGVESDVPVGSYVIEFKDYTGWTTPANQSVAVTDGQTTLVDGTYTRQTGSVSATIAPQGAIDAGAQWRRTGTSNWFDSGAVEGDIPTGSYTVEFKALTGWTSPSNQLVTITNGDTATLSGTYAIISHEVIFQTDATPGATLDGATSQTVNHGADCTPVGVNAPEGWDFVKWIKDGADYSVSSPLTVTNITEDTTLTAVFADITPPLSSILPVADPTQVDTTIALSFAASDSGSGVASTALWVKAPLSNAFVPSGLVQPGSSGTFVYSVSAGPGVYQFASKSTDISGNSEVDPLTADASVILNTTENGPFTWTIDRSDSVTTFPMTNGQDVLISITNATPGGTITVSRSIPTTLPPYFKMPGQVVNEMLIITGTGLGAFNATLNWPIDPANASDVSLVDKAFAFDGGDTPSATYSAVRVGDTVTITGITAFSSWYLGNETAVPVVVSRFYIE